jgi:hypothetical protein
MTAGGIASSRCTQQVAASAYSAGLVSGAKVWSVNEERRLRLAARGNGRWECQRTAPPSSSGSGSVRRRPPAAAAASGGLGSSHANQIHRGQVLGLSLHHTNDAT